MPVNVPITANNTVDATTSTHATVGTSTSSDNMSTDEEVQDLTLRNDAVGGDVGQELVGERTTKADVVSELTTNEDNGEQVDGDRKDDNMVVADSPDDEDVGSGAEYSGETEDSLFDDEEEERLMGNNEESLDQVEELEREVEGLKLTIISLEDENQDLKIHFGELQHSAYMACSLEYAQRMELNEVSKKMSELEDENKALKNKILLLEQEISTVGNKFD